MTDTSNLEMTVADLAQSVTYLTETVSRLSKENVALKVQMEALERRERARNARSKEEAEKTLRAMDGTMPLCGKLIKTGEVMKLIEDVRGILEDSPVALNAFDIIDQTTEEVYEFLVEQELVRPDTRLRELDKLVAQQKNANDRSYKQTERLRTGELSKVSQTCGYLMKGLIKLFPDVEIGGTNRNGSWVYRLKKDRGRVKGGLRMNV